MRVLFVNTNLEREPFPVLPLGLCSVASNFERAAPGCSVSVLDLTFSRRPGSDLVRRIRADRPDWICFGIRNLDNVEPGNTRFYLREIRDRLVRPARAATASPLLVGGSAVNLDPAGVMDFLGADYALYGEGEEALGAFLGSGRRPAGDPPASGFAAPGLVYRASGRTVVGAPARVADLDSLTFARPWRWLDPAPYVRLAARLNVQTKRGCVFRCGYCVYGAIEGRVLRLRSPAAVADEIEEAVAATGIRDIEFTDSVFNYPPGHALDVCAEVRRRGLKINASAMGIHIRYLTPEFLAALRATGFGEIGVTPESAADGVLAGLNKDYDKAEVLRAAAAVRASGMPAVWYFMFGGPGETPETLQETLAFIRAEVPRDHAVVCARAVRIYRGTGLERIARQEGLLSGGADLLAPVFYRSPLVAAAAVDGALARLARERANIIPLEEMHIKSWERFLLKQVHRLRRRRLRREPIWAWHLKWRALRRRPESGP